MTADPSTALAATPATTTAVTPTRAPSRTPAPHQSSASPANPCAHPATPAEAAKCPAFRPTYAPPHVKLIASTGVSCVGTATGVRVVGRFTFETLDPSWEFNFGEARATTSVSGRTVTVTDDELILGGPEPATARLEGNLNVITEGGDVSVPVSVSVACH